MVFSIKIFTVFFVILMTVTFSNARGRHGESSAAAAAEAEAAAAAEDEVLPVATIDPNAPRHPQYGRVIYLRSKDNEETYFLYEKTIKANSYHMKEFLDGNNNNTVVYPVPNVDARTLQLICRWARYHYEKEMGEAELDEYDNKFTERDQAELIDILASANFMDFIELKELMCKAIASLIHNKTPEQIRETFGIRNDFNDPEPEEDPMDIDSQPSSSSSAKPSTSRASSSKTLHKGDSSKKLDKGDSRSKKLDKAGSSSSKRMDIDESISKKSGSSKRHDSSTKGDPGSSSGRKDKEKISKGDRGSTSGKHGEKAAKATDGASKTLERSSSTGSSRHLERTSSSESLKSSKGTKSSKGDGASSSRSKADKTSKKK